MTEKNELLQHDENFRYQLLSRLQQDCDYYLGNGGRHVKHLWAGNVVGQIEAMIALYESFTDDQKPEWITMEEIEKYREEMLKDEEEVIYTIDVCLNEDKKIGELQLIKSEGMYIITLDGAIVKSGLHFENDEEALYEVIEYINQEMFKTKEEMSW